MKAVLWTDYGSPDVLQMGELPKPTPKDNEVLVHVYTTTVTAAEAMMREGKPVWGRLILGFPRPRYKTLGTEFAGVVESVGKNVKTFHDGDHVYGFTGFSLGANAEYLCISENASIAHKPENTTFEEAVAAVDGATTTIFFLKQKANIQAGQKILIIGASGSIGTYAVQLSKHFGTEVTGVCSSRNVELVKSLGADKVIDYTQEDFTQNGETYDLIFDTSNKSSYAACLNSLTAKGAYLPTAGLINSVLSLWTSLKGGKRVLSGMSINKRDSLILLKDLIETGQIQIIIDKKYAFDDIAEAHRYVDTGHKKGNVVVTIAD